MQNLNSTIKNNSNHLLGTKIPSSLQSHLPCPQDYVSRTTSNCVQLKPPLLHSPGGGVPQRRVVPAGPRRAGGDHGAPQTAGRRRQRERRPQRER